MVAKVVSLQQKRLQKENKQLLCFIEQSMQDKDFMRTNLKLLKWCILEWFETEQKIEKMDEK